MNLFAENKSKQLSFIEQLKVISKEIGDFYVLRAHTWPTAVLTRIAVFMEMGALMEVPLSYAVSQLSVGTTQTKNTMFDFVLEQHQEITKLAIRQRYIGLVLPKTGIHVVDLSNPFDWDAQAAGRRIDMISDLAHCAGNCGIQIAFDNLISRHNEYFSSCMQETNQAMSRLSQTKDLRRLT